MKESCESCGCYVAPFCLFCDGFIISRAGAYTICLDPACQQVTACVCALVFDEDHVLSQPFYEIEWYLAGFPTNAELPRAINEHDVKRIQAAGIDIRDEEAVTYFLATGRAPPEREFEDDEDDEE